MVIRTASGFGEFLKIVAINAIASYSLSGHCFHSPMWLDHIPETLVREFWKMANSGTGFSFIVIITLTTIDHLSESVLEVAEYLKQSF